MMNQPKPLVYTSPTILIAALTLLSMTVSKPTLNLVVEGCHLAPPIQDPITLVAFRFPNLVTTVSSVRSVTEKKIHRAL